MGTVKQRLEEIDTLRGIAMSSMILIHTNAYFLGDKLSYFLWDYSQFAVPVFIFCSAYLGFKNRGHFKTFKSFFTHLLNRFRRLLIPYYLFAFIYFLLIAIKEPHRITSGFIMKSLLIIGGIDINWMILLFLMFTFFIPVISYTAIRQRWLFYLLIFFSCIFSFIFIFVKFPYNYRFIMWLPWSVVIFFARFFVKVKHSKKWIIFLFMLSTSIFIISGIELKQLSHSLVMYDNKYPPNIYNLTYGISSILALYVLIRKGLFSFAPLKNILHFLSAHSYTIYFLHILIIYTTTILFKFKFNWFSFFLTVFISSLAVQWVLSFTFALCCKGVRQFEYWQARAN